MFSVLIKRAERRHMAGVGRFDRHARQEARERARAEAEAEALGLLTAGIEDRSVRQAESDRVWAALVAGEPAAVAGAVSNALEARGLNAEVGSNRVGEVQFDLQVPGAEAIPTHQPSLTPSGTPTLKKLAKTEVAHHVRQQVAARVLLAAKEALAQSPAIVKADVSARHGRDTFVRVRLTRAGLDAAPWNRAAWDVLLAADPGVEANIGGRTQELRPLK
ncbi:hypothetical protein [Nocardioides sp.]|uniref:hypothetical protein n=1 Tax=Nocardioides sp. TaxID=35761 RepID=UPI002634A34A|nr:hypothetical protein [Nocardioides sp.]